MLYADMVGLNYGAAISGPALTKSRLEDYQNYPEFRKIMRSSNYWNVALVDFIADSGSNEFAFSLLIALIEPPGDGVIDDLILQTPFFAEIAKINFCGEIKRQKEIYEKENVKTYLKMNLILERALKICR